MRGLECHRRLNQSQLLVANVRSATFQLVPDSCRGRFRHVDSHQTQAVFQEGGDGETCPRV